VSDAAVTATPHQNLVRKPHDFIVFLAGAPVACVVVILPFVPSYSSCASSLTVWEVFDYELFIEGPDHRCSIERNPGRWGMDKSGLPGGLGYGQSFASIQMTKTEVWKGIGQWDVCKVTSENVAHTFCLSFLGLFWFIQSFCRLFVIV